LVREGVDRRALISIYVRVYEEKAARMRSLWNWNV